MSRAKRMHEYEPSTGRTVCGIRCIPVDSERCQAWGVTKKAGLTDNTIKISEPEETITCQRCAPEGPKLHVPLFPLRKA